MEISEDLFQAVNLITYEMVKLLSYGDEQVLCNGYIIRHYYDEGLIVVLLEESWTEVLTVLFNDESKKVEFEIC